MEEPLDAAPVRSLSRLPRHRQLPWGLASVALAALVFAVLPADRIRLGAAQLQGLVGSYAYRAPVPLPPVQGLTVDEVYLPGRVRLVWDDMGISNAHYYLYRINPTNGAVLHQQAVWDNFWEEDVDLGSTTVFEYWVRLLPNEGSGGGGELPPFGATDIEYYPVAGPESKLRFHVENAAATVNQTVDSRYDLRYGNPTYLDFQFGSRTYRGGLFVGFANDPSRVARSFLKFPIPAGVQDGVYFTGSVNAYATALLTGQGVEVGAQKLSDASWNPTTLKWSTAPTVDPAQAPRRFTFSADGWGHWSLGSDILASQGATDPLSIGLASTGESASGQWVYLAKKEYDASLTPRVLIAGHYPGGAPAASDLAVTATSSSSVTLAWSSPIALGESVLQMRTGTGSWQDVFTGSNTVALGWWGGQGMTPASFSETVNGLASNTTYEFRVKCETQAYGDYYSQRVVTTTP